MHESYYKLCLDELNKLKKRPKILLHSCCAPCSSWVITFLTNYFDITILYYNPNISPINEYKKRKQEQIRLINEIEHVGNIEIIDCDYDNHIYEEKIKGYESCPERGARCTICFNLRLEKTAQLAKENGFEYFCSTLTVSPYKNAALINEIGEKFANKYHIKWLYSDFKKADGYKKSIELSKKYNLYRQDYCGCIYSQRKNILD